MLLIGADPEVFVKNKDGMVSAHDFKCGTKKKPQKTKNGAIQVDGMALEFNTKPTDDSVAFVTNIRALLEDLDVIVKKRSPDLSVVAVPTAHFEPDYIFKLPQKALDLGCEPDFNAYTMKTNPRPNGMVPFRTGSGHVHLGWGEFENTKEHFANCCSLAKQLDYYLGVPSLKWDTDQDRRKLYGKAGTFRPKKYGMEYRVLSNAWLNSEETMKFVFNETKRAFEMWNAGLHMFDRHGENARRMIDGV
jgi:hypothetical protein